MIAVVKDIPLVVGAVPLYSDHFLECSGHTHGILAKEHHNIWGSYLLKPEAHSSLDELTETTRAGNL